jgi:hypothetical protein
LRGERGIQGSDGGISVASDPLQDNIALLRQGTALIERLEGGIYAGLGDPPGRGIGAHLRHVLDHYQAFLAGFQGDVIDYDARQRGGAVESDRQEGLRRMAEVEGGLERIEAADRDRLVRVREDAADDSGLEDSSASSVRRELQFLQSHTVHHWAIVSLLLAKRGIAVPENFGLAPSTLRYLARQKACARQAG